MPGSGLIFSESGTSTGAYLLSMLATLVIDFNHLGQHTLILDQIVITTISSVIFLLFADNKKLLLRIGLEKVTIYCRRAPIFLFSTTRLMWAISMSIGNATMGVKPAVVMIQWQKLRPTISFEYSGNMLWLGGVDIECLNIS